MDSLDARLAVASPRLTPLRDLMTGTCLPATATLGAPHGQRTRPLGVWSASGCGQFVEGGVVGGQAGRAVAALLHSYRAVLLNSSPKLASLASESQRWAQLLDVPLRALRIDGHRERLHCRRPDGPDLARKAPPRRTGAPARSDWSRSVS